GTMTVNLSNLGGVTITGTTVDSISCYNASDGEITVNTTGGSGTLTYAWSNGATTSSVANLAPGTYTVTVEDGDVCKATKTIVLSYPDSLSLTITIKPSDCGQANGEIHLTVSGGSGNYTYAWTGTTSNTDSAGNLNIGTYGVTVTD